MSGTLCPTFFCAISTRHKAPDYANAAALNPFIHGGFKAPRLKLSRELPLRPSDKWRSQQNHIESHIVVLQHPRSAYNRTVIHKKIRWNTINLIYRIAQFAFIVFVTTSVSMPLAAKSAQNADAIRQEAQDAYNKQDYSRVFRLVQTLAEQGDTVAQYDLGVLYVSGRDGGLDFGKARTLLEKASAQGGIKAHRNLRVLNTKDWSVVQKNSKAGIFRKSALSSA